MNMKNNIYRRSSFLTRALEPKKEVLVNSEKFLDLVESVSHEQIERIEFKSPKFGETNFGSFKVILKTPHLMEP